jgi:hypothetical protein
MTEDRGQKPGWCIHYRAPKIGGFGNGHDDCEAGVPFKTFEGVPFDYRPCFLDKDTGESKPVAVPCQHLRRPTPEEIATNRAWRDGRMAKLGTVMTGIMPWRKAHKGKSASEVVECPACQGRLHLSISSYNGHVHGRCETPDCVSWME